MQRKGLKLPPTHKDKVCRYLKEHNAFFADLFEKYRYEVFASFPSKEEALKMLEESSSAEIIALLEALGSLLEEENVILHATPEEVKEWLKEIIETNKLGGLLFIWDEFTDFFRANAPVSDLQELAHAAQDIPFYFLPVTHVTPESVGRRASLDENTAKKLFDRFHKVRFELQPVTAYELATGAIEVLPEKEEDWEEQKEILWGADLAETAGRLVAEEEGVSIEHLKNLLPLHPYAAYLLAEIARRHSSSQRSLFKFIKDDEAGFSWFIKNNPQDEDGPFWLLADKLWDYFFSEGAPEDFPDHVRPLVSFVLARLKNIPDPETQTVFKTIMLQRLLYDLNPSPLFSPDRKNLRFALPREIYDRLDEHIRFLKEGGHINISPKGAGNEEYLLPLGYSPDEIKKVLEEVKKEWPFPRFVREELQPYVEKYFEIDSFLEPRFKLKVFSINDFYSRLKSLGEKLEAFEIGVVAIVVSSEEEYLRAINSAHKIAAQLERLIIIVLQPPFEKQEFERWLDHKAKERLAGQKGDRRNEEYHQREAVAVIKDWLEMTSYRDFRAFWKEQQEELRWISFRDFYRKVNNKIFPYGPENICTNPETLYQKSKFSEIKKPLEIGLGITRPDKRFEKFFRALELQSQTDNTPTKKAILHAQNALQEGEGRLDLQNLWFSFSKPPFGLHPAPAGKTYFAFILKDFAKPEFYLYDGVRSTPLSPEGMRDALIKLFRGKIGTEGIFICTSSPETEELISSLKLAFKLEEKDIPYLESLRNYIRSQIKQLEYPLFSFKYVFEELTDIDNKISMITSSFLEETLKEKNQAWHNFLDLIATWLSSEEQVSDIKPKANWSAHDILSARPSSPKEALEIVYLIEKKYGFCQRLRELFTTKEAEKGFGQFIKNKFPPLYKHLWQKNLKINAVIKHLQNLLPEELFCWQEEKIEELLPEIWHEFRILKTLKYITSYYDAESFSEITKKLQEHFKEKTRLNIFLMAQEQTEEISFILKQLARLSKQEKITKEEKERLAELLERHVENVKQTISSTVEFLINWVKQKTGQTISENEANEILNEISMFVCDEHISKVEELIIEKCNKLDRLKSYRFLKTKWEEITNSRSPKDWSEKRCVPIYWLFEGKEYRQLLEILDLSSATDLSLEEIEKMKKFLEHKAEEIKLKTKDKKLAEKILLRRLLNLEDTSIFLGENFIKGLKEELRKSEIPVTEWPDYEEKLKNIARNFLKRKYYVNIKNKIEEKIKILPPEKTKEFVLNLIDDPEIGLKIIEKLR